MIIARNKVTGQVVKCNPTHPQDCYWTLDKRVWVFTEDEPNERKEVTHT